MKTTEIQKEVITENNQFELVKGEFSANDAAEIISHLFQEKINFHNSRSFSQVLRSGNGCEWSIKRIEELKESKKDIKTLIDQAKEDGKSIRIISNISIEVI